MTIRWDPKNPDDHSLTALTLLLLHIAHHPFQHIHSLVHAAASWRTCTASAEDHCQSVTAVITVLPAPDLTNPIEDPEQTIERWCLRLCDDLRSSLLNYHFNRLTTLVLHSMRSIFDQQLDQPLPQFLSDEMRHHHVQKSWNVHIHSDPKALRTQTKHP